MDQGLHFKANSFNNIKAYYDSDWATFPLTRRSISGFFIMFGGNHISWKFKKEVIVSLSFVEAEYKSMRRVCTELAWINRLFVEFEVPRITLIPWKCHNKAMMYITTNLVYHERTKHIELDCHLVREKL